MKIAVGLSGGVDSSVSAHLLQQQGHDVTGIFMKNWATDLPGFKCPWREEMLDAQRIAVRLGIPFKIYDFTKEYKRLVVDDMLDQYRSGNLPNPDVMCNQHVKFDLFLKQAISEGFDAVATGHYARIVASSKNQVARVGTDDSDSKIQTNSGENHESARRRRAGLTHDTSYSLLTGVDTSKDQSYFLYRMPKEALAKTMFPLGRLLKDEVRQIAKQQGFSNHAKKDSVGICFVGDIDINDFLRNYIKDNPGAIVDESGRRLGSHKGLHLYSLGQRQGLKLSGPKPHYVVAKDTAKNQLVVSDRVDSDRLWRVDYGLTNSCWLVDFDKLKHLSGLKVRLRHLGQLQPVKQLQVDDNGQPNGFSLADPLKAISPGQSAVFYLDEQVLGGGILS